MRAAQVLRDRPDIRFDLFGQGQRKRAVMALAARLGLTNIHFHDPVPKSQVPTILAAADVALMTLFKSPLIDIYFENKLVDYMGAGKPILAALDGMQGELIRRHEVGWVVGSLDHEGLARLVARAAAAPHELPQLGENGRRFARETLLLDNILEQYMTRIEQVASGKDRAIKAVEII